MNKQYLLVSPIAQKLYEETARELPLIDYHNHLSVQMLAEDKPFEDISDLWLLSDPYKHRAMRICGIDEAYITGNSSHKDKFKAWCSVYPKLIGGPLYDWSRMELETILGISMPICSENADRIWEEANAKLRGHDLTPMGILHTFNIAYAAPCAGLTSPLDHFQNLDAIAPSLRGDDILLPSLSFIKALEQMTEIPIQDLSSFREALSKRLDAMDFAGCRFSDHALDNGFCYVSENGKNEAYFSSLLHDMPLSQEESVSLSSCILRLLAEEYAKRKWTMQLHIGAQRFTSTRLRRAAGAAGGFAGIGNNTDIRSIIRLLDDLEQSPFGLPRTILYTLNPADNAAFAVLSGSFAGVTQGPAWWWCDHLQGMREMLDIFSCFSVLHTFVGMTTDSRSLLSLLRHDYFRRMLCGWIGNKVEAGEFPDSFDTLKELAEALCYKNAKQLIERSSS